MASTPEQRRLLGERLQHWRHQRDLTLDAISDALKERGFAASASKVGGWATGQYAPSTRDLAEALDEVVGAGGEILHALGYGPTQVDPGEVLVSLSEIMSHVAEAGERILSLTDEIERVMRMPDPRSGDDIGVGSALEAIAELTTASGPLLRRVGDVLDRLPPDLGEEHQRELAQIEEYAKALVVVSDRLGPMLDSVGEVLDREEQFALAAEGGLPEDQGPEQHRPSPPPED